MSSAPKLDKIAEATAALDGQYSPSVSGWVLKGTKK
jgi:hypothetical protein